MWLMRKKVAKVCARCGHEFRAREDAIYCSQKCKQRAYRERKGRARGMGDAADSSASLDMGGGGKCRPSNIP